MEQIISAKNEYIKELSRLNSAVGRRESGLFLVEGPKLCKEVLRSGWKIKHCLLTEKFLTDPIVAQLGDQCILISEAVAKKLSTMDTPPGIFMVVHQKEHLVSDTPFILALDHIADPFNLGAILRSAEAFGVKNVFISDGSVDIFSSKVLRGAMGSAFRVPFQRGDLCAFLNECKNKGYQILGAGLDREYLLLPDVSFDCPTVMVIGNEANGLTNEIIACCDQGVFIPMIGENESLNASVAASIILWEQSKWK